MANRSHRGAWIVYLNGIEVPCPDVTVSYGDWMVPEATLSFPPHRLLERLGAEDRLEVVIFYLDDLIDPERPRFRLLFEGEILGWSYTNSAFGRRMQFNAVADIQMFQQLYFFFMNTVDAATAFHVEPNGAATPGSANVFYPASLFYKGLFRTVKDGQAQPDVTRPYELLINAIKGMTAKALPDNTRSLPSVNFFSRWVRKRNFQNRFVSLPLLEDPGDDTQGLFPIYKAAKCSSAVDAMREGLAPSIGEAGSIFDVLRELFQKAYTDLVMLPTAPALRTRLADGVTLDYTDLKKPVSATEPVRLANYFAKPRMLFAVPPTCNVLFPAEIRSHSFQEAYAGQPTRVYVNDGFIPSFLDQNYFTAAALRVAYPPEANVTLQSAYLLQSAGVDGDKNPALAARAYHNAKNLLVFPEEFFRGPVLHRVKLPAWFSLLLRLSKKRQAVGPNTADDAKKEAERFQQLFGMYAEYEYHQQRFSKRDGSADLVWDPYLVPGLPCVVFDNQAHGVNTVGYLSQVQHTLSAGGRGHGSMTTSVKYTHGRTLWETLELVNAAARDNGIVVGNAPLDPVETVRDASQNFEKAEDLYKSLFFGRSAALTGKKASFDFRDVVGYGVKVGPYDEKPTMKPFAVTGGKWNIDEAADKDIQALPGFQPIFSDFDAAMRYKARPICTLEEYIQFLYPDRTLEQLENEGTLEGRRDRFGYMGDTPSAEYPTAIYWERIRYLRPGPGTRPTPAMTGTDKDANGVATIATGAAQAVPKDFAQTRTDWDSILIDYRDAVYSKLAQE